MDRIEQMIDEVKTGHLSRASIIRLVDFLERKLKDATDSINPDNLGVYTLQEAKK